MNSKALNSSAGYSERERGDALGELFGNETEHLQLPDDLGLEEVDVPTRLLRVS
jgi:hypothetical protein